MTRRNFEFYRLNHQADNLVKLRQEFLSVTEPIAKIFGAVVAAKPSLALRNGQVIARCRNDGIDSGEGVLALVMLSLSKHPAVRRISYYTFRYARFFDYAQNDTENLEFYRLKIPSRQSCEIAAGVFVRDRIDSKDFRRG